MVQPEQKAIIRHTFAQIAQIAPVVMTLFYSRLFELAPQTEPLFRYPLGTAGMARQGAKLLDTLNMTVAYLDRPELLTPTLEELARRHVAYGTEPAHYDAVGEALLWTLHQGLGDGFTTEVELAWTALYRELADTMKRAAYGTPASVSAERSGRGDHPV